MGYRDAEYGCESVCEESLCGEVFAEVGFEWGSEVGKGCSSKPGTIIELVDF